MAATRNTQPRSIAKKEHSISRRGRHPVSPCCLAALHCIDGSRGHVLSCRPRLACHLLLLSSHDEDHAAGLKPKSPLHALLLPPLAQGPSVASDPPAKSILSFPPSTIARANAALPTGTKPFSFQPPHILCACLRHDSPSRHHVFLIASLSTLSAAHHPP